MKKSNFKKFVSGFMALLMVGGVICPGLSAITPFAADEYDIVSGSAKNDPDTSDIADEFLIEGEGTADNNGKILADKSVTHIADDVFKVTLSALAQSYVDQISTTTNVEGNVHPDVVFVVDLSSSMVNNNVTLNGETVTRAEATVYAMNAAINELMASDPQTRIGIVSYGETLGGGNNTSNGVGEDALYLPLDTYTPPEGSTDYILFDRTASTKEITIPDAFQIMKVQVNGENDVWFYPETGTYSTEEFTDKARIKVDSSGNYAYYNANSGEIVSQGTLASEESATLGTNYQLLRVGDYFYLFDLTKKAVTKDFTDIPSERLAFTTDGGDTFYAACLDGSTINLYIDQSDSSPFASLTAAKPTVTVTADDCDYTFNRLSATSFSVVSNGDGDVTENYDYNVTNRSSHTINGVTFYALSTDGVIDFYTSEDADVPVARVSESSPKATYLDNNETNYTFTWKGENSATISYPQYASKNITTFGTTVTVGDYTYYVTKSTRYSYSRGKNVTTVGIYYDSDHNTALASLDYTYVYTDGDTGVMFNYNESTGALNVRYPTSSSTTVTETFTTASSSSSSSTTTSEKTALSTTENITLYGISVDGTISIYDSQNSTSALASVSASSTTVDFEYNDTTYRLTRTSDNTIKLQTVTREYTSVRKEFSNSSVTSQTISGKTYYILTGALNAYISYTDTYANNTNNFKSNADIILNDSTYLSYTDTETDVTFTRDANANTNGTYKILTYKYPSGTETLGAEQAFTVATGSSSTTTTVTSDKEKTKITLSDNTELYVLATGGSFSIFESASSDEVLATVSTSSTTVDFDYNDTTYRLTRTADDTITLQTVTTETKEVEAEPTTKTVDDPNSPYTLNTTTETSITVSGKTYYVLGGNNNVYVSLSSGISRMNESTYTKKLTSSDATYTDTDNGVKITRITNTQVSVTYQETIPGGTTTETFETLGAEQSFTLRDKYTTADGSVFYVSYGNNSFNIYSSATGGSALATISSSSTTATATIGGISRTFTYSSNTSFNMSYTSANNSGTSIAGIAKQAKTTCTLGTGDKIYLFVSDGVMKIYSDPDGEPIKTIEPGKSEAISIGSNKYTIKNNNNQSITVVYQEEISDATKTVTDIPAKKACTVNGKTFYITILGEEGSKIVKIYDSANATTPIATSTSNKFTYDGTTYTIKNNGDSSVTLGYLTSRSATSTGTTTMTIPTTTETTGSSHVMSINPELVGSDGEKAGTHSVTMDAYGTYTQIGLKGAMDMLCATEDTTGRTPIIVLVSDGDPTYSHTDYNNPDAEHNCGSLTATTAYDCYYTIRTAMHVKKMVDEHYCEGDALFYSIGPGVTDLIGETVLYPSGVADGATASYLEQCGTSSDTQCKKLYTMLMNAVATEPDVTIDYVNYADWGIVGELNEDGELLDAFRHVVELINDIPRPITAVTIVDSQTQTQVFDGKNMVFTDTIGDGMTLSCVKNGAVTLTDAPTIRYCDDDGTSYAATAVSAAEAILDKDDNNIGSKYTLTYDYTVIESSTQLEKDLSGVEVNIYLYKSGKQKVEWKIPADLVPAIYPDTSSDEVSFSTTEPIRLDYQLKLSTTETGTYYTNSTTEPATCTFVPSKGNPYYYKTELDTAGQTSSSFIYTGANETKAKTENITSTAANAWTTTTDEAGGYGVVVQSLGNNGVISIRANKIAPDSVVIDYGLPVQINATDNDGLEGTITGISLAVSADTVLNTQGYSSSRLSGDVKSTNADTAITLAHGTAKFTTTSVTYTPTDMQLDSEQVIYYEFKTTAGSYYYSTVTVIPATKIYYEDSFVNFVGVDSSNNSKWVDVGTVLNAYQHADIPGATDANNYGYDGAYLECSTYSLGSAKKTTVSSSDKNAKQTTYAEFTFTGTAFDIISVTSGSTGTVRCIVTNSAGEKVGDWAIDTYYGYTYDADQVVKNNWKYSNSAWHRISQEKVDEVGTDGVTELPKNPEEGTTAVIYTKTVTFENKGALYQIPIIKSGDLDYDTYTVKLVPSYARFFDHTGTGQYDFILDAIRIYNPADPDNLSDVIDNAYESDNESNPDYLELKNVITASEYTDDSDENSGVLFLDGYTTSSLGDGIETYKNYGPNNEIYIAPGQSFAFMIEDDNGENVASVQLSARIFEIAKDETATGTSKLTIKTVKTTSVKSIVLPATDEVYETATDLYYDITDVVTFKNGKSGVILVSNTGDSTISVTNLKVTHKASVTDSTEETLQSAPRLVMTRAAALSAIAEVNSAYVSSITPESEPVIDEIPEFDKKNDTEPEPEPDPEPDPTPTPDPDPTPEPEPEEKSSFIDKLWDFIKWLVELIQAILVQIANAIDAD